MFEGLRYRVQLSSMQRKRRGIKSFHAKSVLKARSAKKSHSEILAIYSEEANEIDILDSEIGSLVTQRLLEQADSMFLPRPDFNDKETWVSYNVTGTSHLSAKAITELSERINKRKNDNWQFYDMRFKFITSLATAMTGAIGTLIGLIAIWK